MAVESLVNPVGLERGPTGAQRSQEVVLLCVCMGEPQSYLEQQ